MMSTTNQRELGNGVRAGGYDQNTDLDAVASNVRSMRRTERQGHDIGREFPMDADWIGESTRYYLTPGGEIVHVTPRDEGREVRVLFPERDSLDADGEPAAFAYTTSTDALMDRMDADGGWTVIHHWEPTDTPRCPVCSQFIRMNRDRHGFPWAGCDRCSVDIGLDELLDQDAVVEVY